MESTMEGLTSKSTVKIGMKNTNQDFRQKICTLTEL